MLSRQHTNFSCALIRCGISHGCIYTLHTKLLPVFFSFCIARLFMKLILLHGERRSCHTSISLTQSVHLFRFELTSSLCEKPASRLLPSTRNQGEKESAKTNKFLHYTMRRLLSVVVVVLVVVAVFVVGISSFSWCYIFFLLLLLFSLSLGLCGI